jgi:hypothetical protein
MMKMEEIKTVAVIGAGVMGAPESQAQGWDR